MRPGESGMHEAWRVTSACAVAAAGSNGQGRCHRGSRTARQAGDLTCLTRPQCSLTCTRHAQVHARTHARTDRAHSVPMASLARRADRAMLAPPVQPARPVRTSAYGLAGRQCIWSGGHSRQCRSSRAARCACVRVCSRRARAYGKVAYRWIETTVVTACE